MVRVLPGRTRPGRQASDRQSGEGAFGTTGRATGTHRGDPRPDRGRGCRMHAVREVERHRRGDRGRHRHPRFRPAGQGRPRRSRGRRRVVRVTTNDGGNHVPLRPVRIARRLAARRLRRRRRRDDRLGAGRSVAAAAALSPAFTDFRPGASPRHGTVHDASARRAGADRGAPCLRAGPHRAGRADRHRRQRCRLHAAGGIREQSEAARCGRGESCVFPTVG